MVGCIGFEPMTTGLKIIPGSPLSQPLQINILAITDIDENKFSAPFR